MLSNFLKVIFRQIFRSRFFTLVNICGLAIGIASSVIIYHYIRQELSYDQFHHDKDITYRVIRQSTMNGMPYPIGITSVPFAPALANDFGNKISDVNRALSFSSLMTYEDKSFIEERLIVADKNFFTFFSYPLLEGDPSTVLDHPAAIAVTRAFASKYFGEENPIGKTLRMDNEHDLMVTGIIDDLPGHTHLQFEAVGSLDLFADAGWYSEWWSNCLNTYVKVPDARDAEYLNNVFPKFMDKFFGEDFRREGNRIGLSLEPLTEIYFNNDTRYEGGVVHGDKKYVYIFTSAGVLLILLAAINYMNLATAQASKRAKEVGIRKTLGSLKFKIAAQFFTESLILCVFAVILALVIVQASVPFLQSLGISALGILEDPSLWLFLLGVVLIIALLSASYPSVMLSSFQPSKVLKGEVRGTLEYMLVRKVLIIFQFGVSVCMIVATLMISRQLEFLQHKDLGFDRDHVLRIQIHDPRMRRNAERFKNEILERNGVLSASYMSGYPGGFHDATTVNNRGTDLSMRMRTLWADEDFAKVLGLDFIAGRSFSDAYPSDSTVAVIINETAVRQLGWVPEQAIGSSVMLAQFDSTYKNIIGVVRDYHFSSLKEKVEPLIISKTSTSGNLLIKLSGKSSHKAIADIEKIWASYGSAFPMEWSFLDKTVNQLYKQEILQGKLFTVFSFLSVFIACLGIMGLTAYLTTQRQKEIGIRKALGAGTLELSLLLMKDTLSLVLIANILAIPAGYYAINSWLSSFAYRAPFTPSIFIAGGLIVFVLAMLVVGSRVIGTTLENPVKALRNE